MPHLEKWSLLNLWWQKSKSSPLVPKTDRSLAIFLINISRSNVHLQLKSKILAFDINPYERASARVKSALKSDFCKQSTTTLWSTWSADLPTLIHQSKRLLAYFHRNHRNFWFASSLISFTRFYQIGWISSSPEIPESKLSASWKDRSHKSWSGNQWSQNIVFFRLWLPPNSSKSGICTLKDVRLLPVPIRA